MPSVCKRKQLSSLEVVPSPKKGKFKKTPDSPASSPIKGPLQDHTETNSPIFVAKCFYGLKKSSQGNDIKHTTPTKNVPTKTSKVSSAKKGQEQKIVDNVSVRVEQLMSEMIANSPVKQRFFESCSRTEFRKLYDTEYKKLAEQVRRESVRMTRRASRIIHSHDDESDNDDCESSDNEEIFEINNSALDCVSEDEDAENSLRQKLPAEETVMKVIASQNGCHTPDWRKSPEGNSDKGESTITNSLGSEKKFFKTRTPKDNSKMYGIVRGKCFDLKVVPKALQAPFHKKTKKAQQKKYSPQNSRRKMTASARLSGLEKPSGNTSLESDMASTDSVVVQSPQDGFWFAPGFLSPERNEDEQSPDDLTCDDDENSAKGDLSLNKSNKITYQRTPPPKKSILGQDDLNHDRELSADSESVSGSIDLLACEEPAAVAVGSEDLFFSQDRSPAAADSTGSDQSNVKSTGKVVSPGTLDEDNVSHMHDEANGTGPSGKKLFPVFTRRSARLASSPVQSKRSPAPKAVIASPKDPYQEQMILDAGQKKFGATQCCVCGMVYCHADPEDEAAHSSFHKRLLEVLKYPGWKKPRILQEYPEDLGQVIMVMADDPKHMRRKVDEVNQVMARELGFPEIPNAFVNRQQKVFLYVYEKEIAGCCVAEPIKEGYRILPGDMDRTETSGLRPWRCSDVPEAAFVGISRLWVSAARRKSGVATKLVDCVRQWFDYGTLTPHHRLAFSDPTPDGRMFAQRYFGSKTFLVYNYSTTTTMSK
ncbi:hypothetical protein EGW08_008377 [Elysia chlorotica]|uniref:N-acetyltransferase domain-containing protein n=1 Tax=Elysia chlorotica TaxID=188477 RepID=A0A433TQR5_ELYCH|nr:hypothetical protein EGW08_008377 [Elysia chlorotica]